MTNIDMSITDKSTDLVAQYGDRFRLIEQPLPVELHFEFKAGCHAYAIEVAEMDEEERTELLKQASERLFCSEDFQEKKDYITKLALLGDPKAHTLLRRFHETNDPELGDWCALAVLRSQLDLTEEFDGEDLVYVATGLGGKDNLMRESMVLLSDTAEVFTQAQKGQIEKECRYQLQQMGGKVETIEVEDRYALLSILVPLSLDVHVMVNTLLNAINEFEPLVWCPGTIDNREFFTKQDCLDLLEDFSDTEPDF